MANENILLVEHEAAIRMDIAAILKRNGYKITGSFHSGKKAIKYLEKAETKPDLALIEDTNIPKSINGIETGTLIYNKYNIPIIYTNSSLCRSENIGESKCFGVLNKPFKDEDLIKIINKALAR